MSTQLKQLGYASTCAAALLMAAASGAQAYEPGDVLVQLLVEGFYSDASGRIGSHVNYDSGPVTANPALNLTYFFTKNIAAATVLAVPLAKVDLNVNNDRSRATSQWVLPLSVLGQYHFLSDEMISPYLGAGLTYAWFWEDDSDLATNSHVDLESTWGGLINFGVNIKIPDSNWVAVIDAKKWWLSPTQVRVGGNDFDDITVNPWFFGAGIGYKFSTPPLM